MEHCYILKGYESLWPSGFEFQRVRLSSSRCFIYLLGLQGVQWIQELVVVRVS
jgi:hypothetical protein